jgi:serine/threonine-protein kinase
VAEDVFGIVGSAVAGAFQVEAVVAEGGFGVVYRAYHAGFRAPVALKCLKIPGRLNREKQEKFLEQFRAEAELLFRLSASIPTVVRPLHIDAMVTSDGTFVPFMALEWLDGETLAQDVERRVEKQQPAYTMKKLVRLLTPVARALERAHNFPGPSGPMAIVHRDLKPDNIFLAKVHGELVVKILDFGIGKARSVASQVAGQSSHTSEAVTPFTPAYGAPEQWTPKKLGQTGPWTDVWGMALTMVEVAAARPIIDGDQAEMMAQALDPEERPTPRSVGLPVEDEVEKVFAKALAVDPRERFADVGLFWDDLAAALRVDVEPGLRLRRRRDPRAESTGIPVEERIEAAMPVPKPRILGLRLQAASPQPPSSAEPAPASPLRGPAIPAVAASAPVPATDPAPSPPPAAAQGPLAALAQSATPASGPVASNPAPSSNRGAPAPAFDSVPPSGPRGVSPIGAKQRGELTAADFGAPEDSGVVTLAESLDTAGRSVGITDIALDDSPPPRSVRDSVPGARNSIPGGRASTSGRFSALKAAVEPEPPPSEAPPEPLARRFGPAVGLILAGTAVALADRIYASTSGSAPFAPAIYVAGLLVFAGAGLFVFKLVR